MRSVLLDAGPMVALFATDDLHHARFDAALRRLAKQGLRLLSTWPCVVEASYRLDAPQRFELLRWIELGAVQMVDEAGFSRYRLPDGKRFEIL